MNTKNHTIAQIAYLAGIIDGEGSIYIGNFSRNKKTNAPHYQTNIEITSTDKVLIDWLIDNFGGRMSIYNAKQTPKNSRRTAYRWTISGDKLSYICEIILPYLVIKRRQAEIMIEVRKTFIRNRAIKGVSGFKPLEPDVLIKRKMLFDEIRSLHCRNYLNKNI